MKRNNSPRRATTFPTQFARAHNEDGPLKPGVRRKKIFVISETRYLPGAKDHEKKIRRILILDDHPDSLRLVLRSSMTRRIYLAALGGPSSRHLILPGIALLVALLAMFWPLL
jgi:hypothetical protein